MSDERLAGRRPALRSISPRLRLNSTGRCEIDSPVDLTLEYVADGDGFHTGGNLWIFYDIRQFTAAATTRQDFSRPDGIVVAGPSGSAWSGLPLKDGAILRTLDLYPKITELLHGLHIQCIAGELAHGQTIRIRLKTHPDGFMLPRNAVHDFFFGAVEYPHGALSIQPVPNEVYWNFHPRYASLRVLQSNGLTVSSGPPAHRTVVVPSKSIWRATSQSQDGTRNGSTVTGHDSHRGRALVRANLADRHGNPIEDRAWMFTA